MSSSHADCYHGMRKYENEVYFHTLRQEVFVSWNFQGFAVEVWNSQN